MRQPLGLTGYATSAGTATFAASAGSAGSATFATSSGYATNAGTAVSAAGAGTATFAVSSGYATNAGLSPAQSLSNVLVVGNISGTGIVMSAKDATTSHGFFFVDSSGLTNRFLGSGSNLVHVVPAGQTNVIWDSGDFPTNSLVTQTQLGGATNNANLAANGILTNGSSPNLVSPTISGNLTATNDFGKTVAVNMTNYANYFVGITPFTDTNSAWVTTWGSDTLGKPGVWPYATIGIAETNPAVSNIYIGVGSFSLSLNNYGNRKYIGSGPYLTLQVAPTDQDTISNNTTLVNMSLPILRGASVIPRGATNVIIDHCVIGATNGADLLMGIGNNWTISNTRMYSGWDVGPALIAPLTFINDTFINDGLYANPVYGWRFDDAIPSLNPGGPTTFVGGDYYALNGIGQCNVLYVDATNGDTNVSLVLQGPRFWHSSTNCTSYAIKNTTGFTNINGWYYDNGVPVVINSGVPYYLGATNAAFANAIFTSPDGTNFAWSTTITNGLPSETQVVNASNTLINAITGATNNTHLAANGILTNGSSPSLVSPAISGNLTATNNANLAANGVLTNGSSPTLVSPIISGNLTATNNANLAANGILTNGSSPNLVSPTISGNLTATNNANLAANGVLTNGSSPTLVAPTITGNFAPTNTFALTNSTYANMTVGTATFATSAGSATFASSASYATNAGGLALSVGSSNQILFVNTSGYATGSTALAYSPSTTVVTLTNTELNIIGTNSFGTAGSNVLNVVGGTGGQGTNGQAVTITSGTGGTGTTSPSTPAGAGGDMTFTTGIGGVQGNNGANGGNFNFNGGNGATDSVKGGSGGGFIFTGGIGGTGSGSSGGTGGVFTVTGGTGGSSGASGGKGGTITMTSGAGTNGSAAGSSGGDFVMTSGLGGTGAVGGGGGGGKFTLTSGKGGNLTGSMGTAGNGGDFTLVAGNGGSGDGQNFETAGNGGSGYFNPGAKGTSSCGMGCANGNDGIVGICVNPTTGVAFGGAGVGTKTPTNEPGSLTIYSKLYVSGKAVLAHGWTGIVTNWPPNSAFSNTTYYASGVVTNVTIP